MKEDKEHPELVTSDMAKIRAFKRALLATSGNIAGAADLCNIARSTAYEWIKRYRALKRLAMDLRKARHRIYYVGD